MNLGSHSFKYSDAMFRSTWIVKVNTLMPSLIRKDELGRSGAQFYFSLAGCTRRCPGKKEGRVQHPGSIGQSKNVQNACVAGQPRPMASEANSSFISTSAYGLEGQLQFHFTIIH